MRADCHMHMILDGIEWKSAIARHAVAPDIPWIRQQLAIYQSKGITYLRDGGDRWGAGAAARALAPEYGILYRTPLAPLCKKGHYGAFIGTTYENFREYANLVVNTRKSGGDFIKIMISGLRDFNKFGVLTEDPLEEKDIRELCHIAHEEGMAVMAHANGARCVEAAAKAGIDSIEHGAYLDKDALQAMEDNHTVWVPTLATVGNLRGTGRHPEEEIQKIFCHALQNLSDYKGLVAPGTDAGAWSVPHGTDCEEDLLMQAGITKERLALGTQIITDKF